jgi:chromosome partitioning protein
VKHPEDARFDVDTDLNAETPTEVDGNGANTDTDAVVENDSPAASVENDELDDAPVASDPQENSASVDSDVVDDDNADGDQTNSRSDSSDELVDSDTFDSADADGDTDLTEADNTEADKTEADNTDADNTDADNTDTDEIDVVVNDGTSTGTDSPEHDIVVDVESGDGSSTDSTDSTDSSDNIPDGADDRADGEDAGEEGREGGLSNSGAVDDSDEASETESDEENSLGEGAADSANADTEDHAAVGANVSRETPAPISASVELPPAAAIELHHEPVSAAVFDDSTPLARELADITRRRQALAAQPLPLPSEPRIFTVANQKGGVGKTTTTVNLAAALARGGANVLVIDLDPQGNASTALGVEHRADTVSVYDVIINDQLMADVVQKSPEFDGLFCVPATIHLAGAEIELVSLVAREQRLRTALDRFLEESERDFHYVIIDCPPSLGLLTINAFVAAREVLIPIQCEYYALEGLSQLLSNIQLIERHLNPQLKVSTILLTMYDSRTNLANQVADEVRGHFPDQVLRTLIPRSVRIAEAPGYGQSVISYDPSSPGSLSYLEAAAEIARRGASS